MPLHITLSKLVFTIYCICFYYMITCPVLSAYTISVISFSWSRCIGCWLWTGHYFSYFVYCVVCEPDNYLFTSPAQVPLVLFYLLNPRTLPADFEQVIVPVICFLVIFFLTSLLTGYWYCFMSAVHRSPVSSLLYLRCVGWLWTGHCSGFIVSGTVY